MLLDCPICRSTTTTTTTTVGIGDMADIPPHPTSESLPPITWETPTCSYVQLKLPLQEDYPGYPLPLYLSAAPGTEGGTVTGQLVSQWPPGLYNPGNSAHPMQPIPLPSLPETASTTTSKPECVSRKVLSDEDRANMRAYAAANPKAT